MPTIYEVTDESGGTIDWLPTKKEATVFARENDFPTSGIHPIRYGKPTKEGVCYLLRTIGDRQ